MPEKPADRERSLLTEQLANELAEVLLNEKVPLDIVQATTGEIIIPANRKITKPLIRYLAKSFRDIELDPSPIRQKIRTIIQPYESKFADLDRATPEFQYLAELKKLAEQEDAEAQYTLGCRYFWGQYPFIKRTHGKPRCCSKPPRTADIFQP